MAECDGRAEVAVQRVDYPDALLKQVQYLVFSHQRRQEVFSR